MSKKRIDELRRVLNQANVDYFVHAAPTMPDREYDELLAELTQLEERHPEHADPDSPTQRVGEQPTEGFVTVEHAVPMMSIDNTYDIDALRAWHARVCRGLDIDPEAGDGPDYVCDAKIDGVAISLVYEDGRLVRAVTRGDGRRGDDVTVQVRAIRAIPLTLKKGAPELLDVRGEIYMPDEEFRRINEHREAAGEPVFANPRNSTAGTLKSLDPSVVAGRRLRFVAHGRGHIRGASDGDHWSFLDRLEKLGIPVGHERARCAGIKAVIERIEQFDTRRGDLGFGVDGMVVRVNTFADQEELGATSKAPRWCIAYKYPAEQGETKLLRVDWQVGKSGTLTPRATMEPIFLAGTTVQHATLHNIEEIRRKDIRIGDTVVIEKAGEIIPQVLHVKKTAARRGKSIEPPGQCPECAGVVEQEGPKVYCVNPECPAQFREKLKWFVGRGQMDIDGLGEKLIDQLVDAGLVHHFADIFTLQREDLLELERMGERSADNLLAGIEASRSRGLRHVLAGLGIRHIGSKAASILANNFADAETLQRATEEQLAELPEFGAITARTLHDYLQSSAARDTLRRLAAVGVDLAGTVVEDRGADAQFAGKTIVLTGTLESMTRAELTESLERRGAKVSSSVSKKTDLVIVGGSPGSKAKKAEALGIETWGEDQIVAALER